MLKNLIIIMCALLCLSLCGCDDGGDKPEATNTDVVDTEFVEPLGAGLRKTMLYYQDANGYVVPIMKQIPWEEGIGKAALNYLKANDANNESAAVMSLSAIVPAQVEFGLRISDDMCATVDLKNVPIFEDAVSERAMITAIVNTLVEFPTIETVEFTLEGDPARTLSCGLRIDGKFECMNMNVENGELATSGTAHSMGLYFPNSSGSLNIPVTRYCDSVGTFTHAVQALVNGPETDNLICCFPDGTEVLSAHIEDGVATVNLSEAFMGIEYTEGLIEAARETLFLTAKGFGDVESLKLLVDGVEFTTGMELPMYANSFR